MRFVEKQCLRLLIILHVTVEVEMILGEVGDSHNVEIYHLDSPGFQRMR